MNAARLQSYLDQIQEAPVVGIRQDTDLGVAQPTSSASGSSASSSIGQAPAATRKDGDEQDGATSVAAPAVNIG